MTTLASSVGAERAEREQLDHESRAWLDGLRAAGAGRSAALERLHDLLLRAAHARRTPPGLYPEIAGAELDDLCRQAADDAVVAVTGKLDGFRGASRFTTWAYGFAVFEVSVKLRRHAWRGRRSRPPTTTPRGTGWPVARPAQARVESADLLSALRRAVAEELSPRQREVFVAVALNDVEIDASRTAELDPRRGLQGAPRRTAEAPPASRARRTPGPVEVR